MWKAIVISFVFVAIIAAVSLFSFGKPRHPYCVIDLSAGAEASSYPVTYLDKPPSGGFNTDEYKMTKLVLKRIEAGSFQMSKYKFNVTLTKPFFIGVFEVTQKQYQLVMGYNPSSCVGDGRPAECVSYDIIRGASTGSQWPESNAVDVSSFLGRLRARTGIDFDLPTEAQWEYACRAGTTSNYNNGGSSEGDLKQLARYSGNHSDGKGGYSQHTTVGSYQPNAWGLYDMHGNVWEWCLDWYGSLSSGAIDPKGSSSGSFRAIRGGCWDNDADACNSSFRSLYPSDVGTGIGFRLARTLSE